MSQTRNAKTAHTMVRAEATWKTLMAFARQATDLRKIAIGRSPDLEDSLLQDFAMRPMNLTRAFHSVLDKQDPIYLKLLHGFLKHLPSRTVFTQIVTHLRPEFEVLANLALVWDGTSAPTTKQRTCKPAPGFWDN